MLSRVEEEEEEEEEENRNWAATRAGQGEEGWRRGRRKEGKNLRAGQMKGKSGGGGRKLRASTANPSNNFVMMLSGNWSFEPRGDCAQW
ncbi:unnamed protein product [Fusarium graminearum]|nr:unnamed protein product [Fusarium graminearum]